MLKDIIINQVKGLLRKAIERFALKELGVSSQVVGLIIRAKDDEGNPEIRLCCNYKKVKEVFVRDLYSNIDIITYKTMGFNPDTGTKDWLQKFIVKVAKDFNYDIKLPELYLGLNGKELFAILYANGKQIDFSETRSDIPLEYILTTK